MTILDGRELSIKIKDMLKEKYSKLDRKLGLAIIVANNYNNDTYIKLKREMAEELGVNFYEYKFTDDFEDVDVIELIEKLNISDEIDGIIIELPIINNHSNVDIIETIDGIKDIDCLTASNYNKLIAGNFDYLSCSAKAILSLLDLYKINFVDKKVAVVGTGRTVPKSLGLYFNSFGIEVIVSDCSIQHVLDAIKDADIVIFTSNIKRTITEDKFKDNVVIIDGSSALNDAMCVNSIVDSSVKSKCIGITPRIGGVGPLTIVMNFVNLYNAYNLRKDK